MCVYVYIFIYVCMYVFMGYLLMNLLNMKGII